MHRKGRQAESEKPPIPPKERDRMEKARAIAKQAPVVQSAEAKLKSATTLEERHQAAKEFHEAMRHALLTADPTLSDLLDKQHPPCPLEPKADELTQAPPSE
jgi:hypothetical protein